MFESIDKIMLAGLGALSMTKEKAEKIFDDYVSRGQAERKSKTGFVKEVMDSAEKSKKELQKFVSDQVQGSLDKLGVVTKDDLKKIESKLDKLLKKE